MLPGARTAFWTVVVAGWAAVLAAGITWIKWRVPPAAAPIPSAPAACLPENVKRTQSGFVARRPLAKNRLLRENDVDWTRPTDHAQKSRFLGRYATCEVKAGDIIAEAETAPIPTVVPPAGHVIFPVALDEKAFEAVDAGVTLDIFIDRVVMARGAPVLAVQCRQAPAADCAALVDVAPDEAVRLAGADTRNLRIVAIAKP